MARHQPRSRYTAYDGGPDPLAPPVDIAEALDAIGQDVMAGYSPERAMREFLRRGGQNQNGLDDLARQVAAKRRELLQKHSLDGTLEEIRELLDHAVLEERKQLARDVELDDADRDFLGGLPVLGESELYDEICDRLDATNDGERAGAIELALEGLFLAQKVSKESSDGETVYG